MINKEQIKCSLNQIDFDIKNTGLIIRNNPEIQSKLENILKELGSLTISYNIHDKSNLDKLKNKAWKMLEEAKNLPLGELTYRHQDI